MSSFTKLFFIAVVVMSPVAAAEASGEANSVQVRTNDIDLASASAAKIMAVRIDRAARKVCDFANDRLDYKVRKIERKCRNTAKASAWAAVKLNRHWAAVYADSANQQTDSRR